MQVHEVASQGEADAEAGPVVVEGGAGLDEGFEDGAERFGLDAEAVVLDLEEEVVAVALGPDADRACGLGEFDGVLEQAVDGLLEADGVGLEREGVGGIEGDVASLGLVGEGGDGGAGQGGEVGGLGSEYELAGVEAGDVEEVVEQVVEDVELAGDGFLHFEEEAWVVGAVARGGGHFEWGPGGFGAHGRGERGTRRAGRGTERRWGFESSEGGQVGGLVFPDGVGNAEVGEASRFAGGSRGQEDLLGRVGGEVERGKVRL